MSIILKNLKKLWISFGWTYPYTRVMYGIRSGSATGFFYAVRLVAFFTEIFFQISVVILLILNKNLHYQIFKFVIDNSDISLNCLQHIQKRRNFDPKGKSDMSPANLFTVTCHTKWSRSGTTQDPDVAHKEFELDSTSLVFRWPTYDHDWFFTCLTLKSSQRAQ